MEDPGEPGTFVQSAHAGHDSRGRDIGTKWGLVSHLEDPAMHSQADVRRLLRAHQKSGRHTGELFREWRPILTAIHYRLHGRIAPGIGEAVLEGASHSPQAAAGGRLPPHR